MKFKDLKIGESSLVKALLTGVEERSTKGGSRYLVLTLSDGEKSVMANYWNCDKTEFQATEGQVVELKIDTKIYKGSISYTVQSLVATQEDPSNYIPSAPKKPEEMYAQIYKVATGLGVYSPVVCYLLDQNKERLLLWAAGKSVHHNIRGGLLYHAYTMLLTANSIYKVYSKIFPLDKNLLYAGVILHDIGKVRELSCSNVMNIDYTPDGNLLGHLFIGAEMVGQCARDFGIDEEKILLLQHMLVSHHGKREMGAITLPAIPEAAILHHLDCLDAEMYMYRTAREETEPGEMSERIYALECRVYNPKNN